MTTIQEFKETIQAYAERAKTVEGRVQNIALDSVKLHPKDFEAAVGVMLKKLGMTPELDFLAGESLRKEVRYYLAEARGGGQSRVDTQAATAPATPSAGADDKDQLDNDTQVTFVPSAPAPRPRQIHHHAVATQTIVKSIFDEFKVTRRQGSREPIGDVRMASLSRLAQHNDRRAFVNDMERAVYCQILSWAEKQAHIPKDARVRDVLDVKLLKSFIEAATEVADARARITYRPEQLHA